METIFQKIKNLMDEKFFSSPENVKNLLIGGEQIKDLINESSFTIEDFKPYIPWIKILYQKIILVFII